MTDNRRYESRLHAQGYALWDSIAQRIIRRFADAQDCQSYTDQLNRQYEYQTRWHRRSASPCSHAIK